MLAKAEQLGGEGNVEEAQKVLENVEKSRALKKEAEVIAFFFFMILRSQMLRKKCYAWL